MAKPKSETDPKWNTRVRIAEGIWFIRGTFMGRYTVPNTGKRYDRSLARLVAPRPVTNKTEAKGAFEEMKRMAHAGQLDATEPAIMIQGNVTLAEYLLEYRKQYCEKPQHDRPHAMIEFDAAGLCTRGRSDRDRLEVIRKGELGEYKLVAISEAPRVIAEWLADLKIEREITGSTLNRYRALLNGAFNYAVQTDEWGVKLNPFWKRKLLPFADETARVRRVSLVEEDILFAYADGQMFARLQAALKHGFRRGEILKAQLKMFDFKEWTLTLPRDIVKTNKSARRVPIHDPKTRTFLQGRRFLGPNSYPFGDPEGKEIQNFNTAWQRLLRNAFNVEDHTELDLRFHDLRAEFVSRCCEADKNLDWIADFVGDTRDTVEKHYKRVLSLNTLRKVTS